MEESAPFTGRWVLMKEEDEERNSSKALRAGCDVW